MEPGSIISQVEKINQPYNGLQVAEPGRRENQSPVRDGIGKTVTGSSLEKKDPKRKQRIIMIIRFRRRRTVNF